MKEEQEALINWVLVKWKKIGNQFNQKFSLEEVRAELKKLNARDLDLLARYTWLFSTKPENEGKISKKKMKRSRKLLSQIHQRGFLKRAGFKQVENFLFPD